MNINFHDLPSFNSYLSGRLRSIVDNSQNMQADRDELIQLMRQNEGLLQDKNSTPQDVVTCLHLSNIVRKLGNFETEGNSDIEKVMRSASTVLSRLGNKIEIAGKEKPVDTFNFLYMKLIKVDRATCYQTLAGWIAQNKVPIKSLQLPEDLLFELAPHMTYLDLTDADDFWVKDYSFTDEFVGRLLEKTEHLSELRIKSSSIDGSALAQFKNAQQLVSLAILNCPNFNHPLPENMENLETLNIWGCGAFKQPLPTGMNKLQSFSCYGPYLEARTVLNFLLPLVDESQSESEQDRGGKLAEGLFEGFVHGGSRYGGDYVLSTYEYFIKQKPEQIDAITALVEKVKPKNLLFHRMEKAPTVEGDPLQNICICQIATKLGKKSFGLIEQVLRPLMKTPMDPALQQFYERVGSLADPKPFLEFLKGVSPPETMLDGNTYLDLLAEWIAKDRVSLKSLELSDEALLELAPHLTYLNLNEEDPNKVNIIPRFQTEFLGKLLEKTEKVTFLRTDNYSAFPLIKHTQHLEKIEVEADLNVANLYKFLNFLSSIYIEDRERALKLAQPYEITELTLLQYHFEVKDRFSYYTTDIRAWVEKITPEKLYSMLRRNDIPFVNDESLKDDPMQRLNIYNLFAGVPNEKIPFLKEMLAPLIRSPMREAMRQFYEFCDSRNLAKLEDANAFYDLLAQWIAQDKVALKILRLPENVMLALAPHLTYLDLSGRDLKTDEYVFSTEFLGNLLEKTERLDVLIIKKSNIDEAALSKFKNTQYLLHFWCIDSPSLTRTQFVKFLIPIYFNNPLSTDGLAKYQGEAISETEILTTHFVSQNRAQTDAIRMWIARITPEKLGAVIARNNTPFVREDLLKNDPLQQLCIYNLCSGISSDKMPQVSQFLSSFIKTPMDDSLQRFYESITSARTANRVLDWFTEVSATPETPIDWEFALKLMPYIVHVDEKVNRELIMKNLENLAESGMLDLFLEKFPPSILVARALATEIIFTENSNENKRSILDLFDLETKFNEISRNNPIANFPVEALEKWVKSDAVGRALIKLNFNYIVTVQHFQEILLRAFPPSKPENLLLYPVETRFHPMSQELVIHVVPTLPVADAAHLLKTIVRNKDISWIKIHYFGSPGADHTGLGRQFVSEVMQGYVINQNSLFIRSAGGGMYPYDVTHTLGANANRESYKDLGMFLGMALQWEYPIGLILSEKTLNGMLAFSGLDLFDEEFDIKQFIARMDAAAFISFMKEASIEHENSVKLYEGVFLSDNPEAILESARQLNELLADDEMNDWIAGGAANIKNIQERLRTMWVEDHNYSLTAVHAMAQGLKERLPNKIGDHVTDVWDEVPRLGAKELSKHLQGELTAQYLKEHIHLRVIGEETPEKRETADNVRRWTDEWIDENGNDPEKLANFVQAFSGARAMTKDIYLDINPAYYAIEAHTCFNRADIPPGAKEGFVKLMWDDFALGNFEFNKA